MKILDKNQNEMLKEHNLNEKLLEKKFKNVFHLIIGDASIDH